ncbi:MAG: lipopolysaccharide biosynthesis protein [Lacipirellulaceae bacterium]
MSQSSLLLLNIGTTFARMGVTVLMGLWTTRIAYRELGADGFGAYAAALGLVAFVMLLGDALSSSAQRHIAFALGAEDRDGVRATTGSVVSLMLLLASLLGGGIVFASYWLAAPLVAPTPIKELLPAAVAWIGGATAITLAEAPFRAYLIARQSIVLVSLFELMEGVAKLFAAALLLVFAQATIADYARWACLSAAVPSTVLVSYCLVRHPMTRPGRIANLGQLSGFASWMLAGLFGWKLRTQGVQVLVNLLAGAVQTASYSVCMQIAMYQNSVSFAIYRAIRPATIAAHGRQAGDQVRRLSLGASKAMGLANLLITVPLWFETRTLLELWIGDAPDSMVTMVRLLVAWISVRDLTIGHEMAVHGTGKVALHETLNLSLDVVALGLGAAAVAQGAPAWTLVAAVLCAVVGQTAVRVLLFGSAAHATPADWLREVVGRYAATLAFGGVVAATVVASMAPSPTRCLVTLGCATVATVVGIVTVGLTKEERKQVGALFTTLRSRFA